MLVHRIEQPGGTGVFKGRCRDYTEQPYIEPQRNRKCPMDHKTPYVEGIKMVPSLYCGCRSADQLRLWFGSNHCADFTEHGAEWVTYEVDPEYVQFGETQLAFVKANAREVDRRPAIALYI
jgi:hypothetical protein